MELERLAELMDEVSLAEASGNVVKTDSLCDEINTAIKKTISQLYHSRNKAYETFEDPHQSKDVRGEAFLVYQEIKGKFDQLINYFGNFPTYRESTLKQAIKNSQDKKAA